MKLTFYRRSAKEKYAIDICADELVREFAERSKGEHVGDAIREPRAIAYRFEAVLVVPQRIRPV